MKISFQKWLKRLWISLSRFIHDAESDAQMGSLKLKDLPLPKDH